MQHGARPHCKQVLKPLAIMSTQPLRITLPRPNGPAKRWGQPATQIAQQRLRVTAIRRESSDAVTLELASISGNPLPFKAGQYLTHCFEIEGVSHKRAYSISSAEGGRLACTIKAVADGIVSGFVARQLQAGYEYAAFGPSGDFLLPLDAQAPLAFLAAGSGITPIISLIETALAQNPERSIHLLYASRKQGEIIFEQRLAALAAQHPSLTLTHVLSRPKAGWKGEKKRLDGPRAAALLAPAAHAHVYLCGPTELMDATAAALPLPSGQIHRERFFAAPKHTRTLPTTAQTIRFAKSGKSVTQRPGESVLDAGLREGLALPFSCTVGGCAACKVKVLEGELMHDEPNCLSAEERAQGYALSCSSYCLTPSVIDA
jgi:ferredoxin-NADP reductase